MTKEQEIDQILQEYRLNAHRGYYKLRESLERAYEAGMRAVIDLEYQLQKRNEKIVKEVLAL